MCADLDLFDSADACSRCFQVRVFRFQCVSVFGEFRFQCCQKLNKKNRLLDRIFRLFLVFLNFALFVGILWIKYKSRFFNSPRLNWGASQISESCFFYSSKKHRYVCVCMLYVYFIRAPCLFLFYHNLTCYVFWWLSLASLVLPTFFSFCVRLRLKTTNES